MKYPFLRVALTQPWREYYLIFTGPVPDHFLGLGATIASCRLVSVDEVIVMRTLWLEHELEMFLGQDEIELRVVHYTDWVLESWDKFLKSSFQVAILYVTEQGHLTWYCPLQRIANKKQPHFLIFSTNASTSVSLDVNCYVHGPGWMLQMPKSLSELQANSTSNMSRVWLSEVVWTYCLKSRVESWF